ncbi:MAG: nucleotide exchange factor GrpE [Thiocapsa sp.]|uniref:nucleotide exchange factor GrpE n=1 Tax=Thiocapsa sp. TaxID=2024551 RepID=UPI001BCDBEC4|nr:nucleotide exchange factor GrpE [Thiocapsa sp.]QVL49200.1 MAG: nucleotide exchange factor GrpE [Thiocapsa sp.]
MSTESAKQTESNASVADEAALLEDASAPRAGDAEGDRASAAQAPTPEQLQSELAAARAEAESLRDQALRVRAEMENLRRRHTIELEKAHKYALDSFVRELLQVRDSLELGHDAALADGADIAKLREGTELTLKLLGDVMDRFGVVPVDPIEQPFDPEFHQAMTVQPRSDLPPNTVVAVMQKGYTLNGRLVRPALVMVSQQAS